MLSVIRNGINTLAPSYTDRVQACQREHAGQALAFG